MAGTLESRRRDFPIPNSVSTLGDSPPAVSEALHYHQCRLADLAAASAGCRLNPLRSVMALVAQSIPLQHAVILLAATHRQQSTIQLATLKSKALKSFAKTLPRLDDTTKLAVILVLLYTDFVHSGQSPWFTHLSAVAKIIKIMCEGRDPRSILQQDSLRAIVLQFHWFDITSALLLVRPPILPVRALDDALRINEEHATSPWHSITYDVFGLTERTFSTLSRIARGHDDPIHQVQTLDIPDPSSLIRSGWTLQDAQERMHVDEIWKHATATYLMTRHSPYRHPRRSFELHAQRVFTHASSLSTKRRLVLLPLLFAGSCTPDSERGDFMQRYCIECFDETKFGVFRMGLEIMRQVWTLRAREEEERRALGGRAYSCWRNVTAGMEVPVVRTC